MYLLYRLLKEKRTVIYASKKEGVGYLFTPDGKSTEFEFSSPTDLHTYSKFYKLPSTVLICDSWVPPHRNAFTVIINSPNFAAWKEFAKTDEYLELYLPTYNDEELWSLKSSCYSHLSDDGVKERLKRWGPNPRYVLNKIDPDIQDEDWQKAIATIKASTLSQLDELFATSQLCHKLFFIQTAGQTSTSSSSADTSSSSSSVAVLSPADKRYYKAALLQYASEYAKEEILKKLSSMETAALNSFVVDALNAKTMGVITGDVFELLVGKRFAEGGKFELRRVHDDREFILKHRKCTVFSLGSNASVDLGSIFKKHSVVRTHPTFKGIDGTFHGIPFNITGILSDAFCSCW